MDMSDLFSIGEVAKFFGVSVGTLRHYERAGLLKPERIDSKTGYRYYSVRQFEPLNLIRYLRALDMPLDEIRDFLQNRDIDVIEEKLQRQKEAVIQKQRELNLIERKIDHRLRQLHDAAHVELDTIQVEEFPPGRIAWMRDSLAPRTYLDLEGPIRKLSNGQKVPVVFLGKVGVGISKDRLEEENFNCYEFVFLLLDDEDDYQGNVENFPTETCVTVRFCGSHAEAPEYYKQLLRYIKEHKLKIAGFSREMTMIDYGITDDTSKFMTEIRIPIE